MATPRRDKAARIVDAALAMATEQGWRAVTLDAVAERCRLTRDEVYRLTPSPAAILDLFARRIDLAVIGDDGTPPPAATNPDADLQDGWDETARDRLFDVLMRRFDALAPYRDAVAALARTLPRDPASVAATLPQARRSFGLMLRAAGIDETGLAGALRTTALVGLWLAVQRDWLRDDTADQAQTMAALDRHLSRLFEWSPLFRNIG